MNIKLLEVFNPVLFNKVHYLTSDYKTRNEDRNNHNGIDLIGNNRNTDYVIAIEEGIVITSTYSSAAGYYVEIRHKNNYISRYLHMKKGTLAVEKGDVVAKGQILGYMGNSGDSNGAHLHFSVYDSKRIPQDPLPYLQGKLNFNENYYEEFIKNVQNSIGARVDGIAGPETLSKTITVSSTINRRHKVVKDIQKYLYQLGYIEVGVSDGIAGPKFTRAVKNYQEDNDCVVDGIITKQNKTWKKLLGLL